VLVLFTESAISSIEVFSSETSCTSSVFSFSSISLSISSSLMFSISVVSFTTVSFFLAFAFGSSFFSLFCHKLHLFIINIMNKKNNQALCCLIIL